MRNKPLIFLTAFLSLAALAGCASRTDAPQTPDAAELSQADAAELSDAGETSAETYILEGARRGLYSLPSDGGFQPDEPVTRGEFLVALWRLAGQPETSGATPPSDLEAALAWADAAGCLDSAADASNFDPDELMTRQAAMESLFSYHGSVSGTEGMMTALYDNAFDDSGEIPAGAKRALYWGFYNVLIREPEPDRIAPSGPVSRGDMAEMMVRYLDDFQSEPAEN